ncbi:5-methyltetrahydropteroyltriglutamate--homocysteine methyltransferase [Prauserella shujinwangii]|uniref:5-methyltetrahydropteroyltriglutamate--homocysteine methyltransferase n=1 Tax=Prauserella shujinwangii TaxID=1453103 RepID=A0A2T0LNE1_9PSEU|nr:cobalamin-independent methionine synthase II family protein [Prauserella shujinwangii]PRX44679.1 5-methyltetrahydropteroyltriglutamate--homocysteine methyltransferase [Prauserella shujinwangii]
MLPTEPIGSIPRPEPLVRAHREFAEGRLSTEEFERIAEEALDDTLRRFAETGSPVVTDGEQAKSSFLTYPLEGADNLAEGGPVIPFEDGHTRVLPVLARGPFRYRKYADGYLRKALARSDAAVKQAVISPSALSLLYPGDGIDGYGRDEFLTDLIGESLRDVRQCLDAGADSVQIDFTEARLALKLDPSRELLRDFIRLNNCVIEQFAPEDRRRIGVHVCPGGDQDSTHSLDVDYLDLLPELFALRAGRFYIQLASEPDRRRVLDIIRRVSYENQLIFIGVTDPISPRVETPEEVCERVLEAAEYLPPHRLGTCDDCGFSPFSDDLSTSRDTAFEKIRARVEGTRMAAEKLGF